MNSTGESKESHQPASTSSADEAVANRSSKILAALTAGALVFGTVMYRVLEGWGWVDSFYFSVITLTTVGFGDFTPTTDASKLFTVVYIFGGINPRNLGLPRGRRSRQRFGNARPVVSRLGFSVVA